MQAEALHCFGLQSLERREWTIKFTLIKEHVGNYGKEIADNLAKEATKNKEIMYNKIPKSQIVQQVKQQSIERWQTQYEKNNKRINNKTVLPKY